MSEKFRSFLLAAILCSPGTGWRPAYSIAVLKANGIAFNLPPNSIRANNIKASPPNEGFSD